MEETILSEMTIFRNFIMARTNYGKKKYIYPFLSWASKLDVNL